MSVFPAHVHELELPPPDQRSGVRREDDRKLYAFLLTLVCTAFAIGVAWATATAAVHQKLDRSEQLSIDARQDAQLQEVRDALHGLKSGVDEANLRLHQMACDGKPPSCR